MQAMLAGKVDHLRVTSELLGRAVAAATRLSRLDQTVGQNTTACQGGSRPLPGEGHARPGTFLAGPASRKALTQHHLVGLGANSSRFEPLAPVLMAGIADPRDSAVTVASQMRELAALAVDADRAIGEPLGIQGQGLLTMASAG